jgi:hypothetical protein
MSLNDIIDFILKCIYVNIRKCRLLSKTNFVMMSNIMLMFLLLLFLAGDVEKKKPGPRVKPNQKRPQYMMLNIHKNVEGLNRVNGISTPPLDN